VHTQNKNGEKEVMGNRCCGSFFGRVMTAKELKRTWPDDVVFETKAGEKTGLQMRQAYTTRAVTDKLSALTVVNVIYFILAVVIAGFGFSVIPGYAILNDTSGTGLRVPHSVWFVSPAILIFLWALSFFFDPYYQTARIVMRSRIFSGFLLIDFLQNIAHLVFVIIEVIQGTTGMASNTSTSAGTFFLIFLIAVLGISIIIDAIIYGVSANYALLLQEGVIAGWEPGAVGSRRDANRTLLDATGKELVQPEFMSTGNDVRIRMTDSSNGSVVEKLLGGKRNRKRK